MQLRQINYQWAEPSHVIRNILLILPGFFSTFFGANFTANVFCLSLWSDRIWYAQRSVDFFQNQNGSRWITHERVEKTTTQGQCVPHRTGGQHTVVEDLIGRTRFQCDWADQSVYDFSFPSQKGEDLFWQNRPTGLAVIRPLGSLMNSGCSNAQYIKLHLHNWMQTRTPQKLFWPIKSTNNPLFTLVIWTTKCCSFCSKPKNTHIKTLTSLESGMHCLINEI